MNIPYVFKKCSKCGEWKVANSINFYKKKSGKYGLKGKCKECYKEYNKQYYETNKDKLAEQKKQYREDNKDIIAEYNKQYYETNKDIIAEQKKQYREDNKDIIAEYKKQYYESNKDKLAEQKKQYREDNKDIIAEYNKQYYETNKDIIAEQKKQYYESNKDIIAEQRKQYYESNKDIIAEYNKQYYETNKDIIAEQHKQYRATPQGQVVALNHCHKRRVQKQTQGNGITGNEWLECMKYFGWKCAYSGIALNKTTRSLDHIIPINKNGEHEIWNLVPMYKNYNSSKGDKDLLEWYKEQDFYSEERLQKIYEWQEYAYNKWHKEEIV